MDIGSILGLLFGVLLIGGSILLEGDAIIYISLNSIMIVLGGTIAATMINFSLGKVITVFKLIFIAFTQRATGAGEIIESMVAFAEKARREGLLALEDEIPQLDNEFLQKGIQLVVDGTDPQLVRSILETKITFLQERHQQGQEVFKTMGLFAPAFGLIGTLIGLIRMLAALDDPGAIGSGMATALITTLYGILLANLVFNPIAGKLKIKSQDEILLKEVMIEGILSIQAGENPRIVEEKLKAFLSEDEALNLGEEGEETEDEMAVEANV